MFYVNQLNIGSKVITYNWANWLITKDDNAIYIYASHYNLAQSHACGKLALKEIFQQDLVGLSLGMRSMINWWEEKYWI